MPPNAEKPAGRLFARLADRNGLEEAWQEVLAHYEAAKRPADVAEFERSRRRRLDELARALVNETFVPEPASLILIPKPSHPGELRKITLAKPEDRIVLTALNRVLTPLFERQFLPHSYAYRKGMSGLAAVERVSSCLKRGLEHAAAGDIDNFFDSIDRGRLLATIRRTIWEPQVLRILELYLHMAVVRRLEWVESDRGIAQGSPLSPLLSNIYLIGFDRLLESSGTEWVRYADNFLLLAQDGQQVRRSFERAEEFLEQSLGLRLNPESRCFSSVKEGFVFLGFLFRDGRRTMSPEKFEQKKAALSARVQGTPGSEEEFRGAIQAIRETVLGWRRYYRQGDTREQLGMLQQHLFDIMTPWLERFRENAGKHRKVAELKTELLELELPLDDDARAKRKWVELLLARTRPAREPRRILSPEARRAIERRKREYLARKQELEEIVVAAPGASLGRSSERLVIRREGKRESETPLAVVRNITLLTTGVSISGELIAQTAARGISIHMLGHDGKPVARIGPLEAPSFHLSAAQTQMACSTAGLDLAKTFVLGKIGNQRNLLRYFGKYGERRQGRSFATESEHALIEMERLRRELEDRKFGPGTDLELERNRLFAAEGQAAGVYWRAIKTLLWQRAGFDGRVRRGASDLVNSLLNYGYSILYSRLLGILLKTGLNVNISFLHKPQEGKPTLLFDFIEEFRPAAVDRVVFSLLNLGKDFTMGPEGLPMAVRRELARSVLRRLQTATRYHGEHLPLLEVAERQAVLLARHVEGKARYTSYVLPW